MNASPGPPEVVGNHLRRMNLTAMAPEDRKRLRVYCENAILRSLLPEMPSPQELTDAKDMLAMIEEIEHPPDDPVAAVPLAQDMRDVLEHAVATGQPAVSLLTGFVCTRCSLRAAAHDCQDRACVCCFGETVPAPGGTT